MSITPSAKTMTSRVARALPLVGRQKPSSTVSARQRLRNVAGMACYGSRVTLKSFSVTALAIVAKTYCVEPSVSKRIASSLFARPALGPTENEPRANNRCDTRDMRLGCAAAYRTRPRRRRRKSAVLTKRQKRYARKHHGTRTAQHFRHSRKHHPARCAILFGEGRFRSHERLVPRLRAGQPSSCCRRKTPMTSCCSRCATPTLPHFEVSEAGDRFFHTSSADCDIANDFRATASTATA